MSLNLKTTETHWYVDENNVMREKSDADHNKHDSAEVNYHAVCAYEYVYFYMYAKKCLSFNPPMRYPIDYNGIKPMSRDHIIYNLCNLIEFGVNHYYYLEKFIPKIIFDKGKGSYMNLQMWLWTKLITDKKIGQLFYPVALMQAVKNSLWNRMLNLLFINSNTEYDIDIHNDLMYLHNKTKASMYYPVYAMKLVGTMMMYVKNNWFTKHIRKQLLKITPDKNYVLRIMFGDPEVTEAQVKSFSSINHPRWSNFINPFRNNTKFRYLTEKETEFNNLDYDYLQWLWSKREQFIQL